MIVQTSYDMDPKAQFFAAFAARRRPPASQIIRPESTQYEVDRLRALLATRTAEELSVEEIRTEVEGNLGLLTAEAFRYFLPAFLHAALEASASLSVFASELIGSLTEPSRADIVEALDRAARIPPGLGLPRDMTELIRQQQLEWFDSGAPQAMFHARVDSLTAAEGAAIFAFFAALQHARGANFPFGELEAAVDRRWSRYRGEPGAKTGPKHP